jgi:hypothetical protein
VPSTSWEPLTIGVGELRVVGRRAPLHGDRETPGAVMTLIDELRTDRVPLLAPRWRRAVQWVEDGLVADVRYLERTPTGGCCGMHRRGRCARSHSAQRHEWVRRRSPRNVFAPTMIVAAPMTTAAAGSAQCHPMAAVKVLTSVTVACAAPTADKWPSLRRPGLDTRLASTCLL